MEVVFGLLLVLLGVSCGTETTCDARHNGALCYGVLRGSVYLQLINDASGVDLKLTRDPNGKATDVLKKKGNTTKCLEPIENRSTFFMDNGTLLISEITMTDSADYKFDASDNGNNIADLTFNFRIEAPVSSLNLSSECLPYGAMRVNCSSEGDSLQYSWNLDGKKLTGETNIIILEKGQSGQLSCSVKNHVSRDKVTEHISICPGIIFVKCTTNGTKIAEWVNKDNNTLCGKPTTVAPTTVTETPIPAFNTTTMGKGTPPPLTAHVTSSISSNHTLAGGTQFHLPWYFPIAASLAGVLLLLGVVVAVYCSQKKKVKPAARPSDADDQDVTYADVRVLQGHMRRKEKPTATEVEYGEVTVCGGPARSPSQDNCVYATVRKGQ